MPHSCSIMEHPFQQKQAPLLFTGGVLPWTFFSHFIQKQLAPESLGSDSLSSQYLRISVMQDDQLLHPVTDDYCSGNSNLSPIVWAKITHFLNPYWTNNPYLPALMPMCKSTHLIHILLICIKTKLHNKFKRLLQWLLPNQWDSCLTKNNTPQSITDKLLWSA